MSYKRNDNKRTIVRWGLPKKIKRFYHRFILRKQSLPRSNAWTIPDNRKKLLQQALKIFLRLILETSLIASAFALASNHYFARIKSDFIITNLTRWMAASLSIKLIMLHFWVTSLVPSLARDETTDWFLQGSYRILLGDCCSINNDPKEKYPTNTDGVAPSIPVRIRQVPGNGSCLFHAIAAGILFDDSTSKDNHDHNVSRAIPSDRTTHPPMSKVIDYSSTLRTLAVETLANGIIRNDIKAVELSETQLVMQNDETISTSSLVNNAAMQYGISSEEYLSSMRQADVWGGGPEIVALANCLERPIVLLEPISEEHENDIVGVGESVVYLKKIATFRSWFRPSEEGEGKPIYILSANQQFPKEYHDRTNNHFLAVFPAG